MTFDPGQKAIDFAIFVAQTDEICEDLEYFYIFLDDPTSCGGPNDIQVFIVDITSK